MTQIHFALNMYHLYLTKKNDKALAFESVSISFELFSTYQFPPHINLEIKNKNLFLSLRFFFFRVIIKCQRSSLKSFDLHYDYSIINYLII